MMRYSIATTTGRLCTQALCQLQSSAVIDDKDIVHALQKQLEVIDHAQHREASPLVCIHPVLNTEHDLCEGNAANPLQWKAVVKSLGWTLSSGGCKGTQASSARGELSSEAAATGAPLATSTKLEIYVHRMVPVVTSVTMTLHKTRTNEREVLI